MKNRQETTPAGKPINLKQLTMKKTKPYTSAGASAANPSNRILTIS
jgi:hypothetical protein